MKSNEVPSFSHLRAWFERCSKTIIGISSRFREHHFRTLFATANMARMIGFRGYFLDRRFRESE
jgi:hypothetical protein